jgi:hypothetical protein
VDGVGGGGLTLRCRAQGTCLSTFTVLCWGRGECCRLLAADGMCCWLLLARRNSLIATQSSWLRSCEQEQLSQTVLRWRQCHTVGAATCAWLCVLLHAQGTKLTQIINTQHENPKYLPGISLGDNVIADPDLESTVRGRVLACAWRGGGQGEGGGRRHNLSQQGWSCPPGVCVATIHNLHDCQAGRISPCLMMTSC